MNYLKKILKSLIYVIGSILFLTILITLMNYYDLISEKIMSITKIIIPIFSFALGGFIIGKNSSKNGWIEGLKLGLILTVLLSIGNAIFIHDVDLKDLVYYVLLTICTIFGSMFGINIKKTD